MPADDFTVSGAQGVQAGDNNVMANFFAGAGAGAGDDDRWCRPAFDRPRYAATPGTPLTLRLFLHNPFPDERVVTLDLYGGCADHVTVPASVRLPGRKRVAVAVRFAVAAHHPPETVRVDLGVRAGPGAARVGEQAVDVEILTRPAVSMDLVGVTWTTRPPMGFATVGVTNTGNVPVRPRLSGVDDWSSSGSVPAEPPEVHLRPGERREVLIRTGRPRLPAVSRHRNGAVTVYADFAGGSVPGPVYEAPPLVSRATTALVAAVVLLGASVGAMAIRPSADGRPGAVAGRSAGPTSETPPTAGPTEVGTTTRASGVAADVVYDVLTSDAANTHTPVLVDREGGRVALPPGGQVTAAVKVPSGWVVNRRVIGDPAVQSRVLYLRDGTGTDLAPGVRSPSFWVDRTGTQVLIDGRGGGAGTVTVKPLPALAPESSTLMRANVRVVGWLDRAVLVSVRDKAGAYDRWWVHSRYEETPSDVGGRLLGTGKDGGLALHETIDGLPCVRHVPHLFDQRDKRVLRCGFGVLLDTSVLNGRWATVSPDGSYLVLPGPNRSAYVGPLVETVEGKAGLVPVAGLPEPIVEMTWRDRETIVALVRGHDDELWACPASGQPCAATPLTRPDGLFPVQLATRVPG